MFDYRSKIIVIAEMTFSKIPTPIRNGKFLKIYYFAERELWGKLESKFTAVGFTQFGQ